MSTSLLIHIECGETTCASEVGEFCQFFGTKGFGQTPICLLFPDLEKQKGDQASTELTELDGWTQRCAACLSAAKEGRIERGVWQIITPAKLETPVCPKEPEWELLARHRDWEHWHAVYTPNEHIVRNQKTKEEIHCFGFWGYTHFHHRTLGIEQYTCPENCPHSHKEKIKHEDH
jgi:hypothetical protein